MKTAIGGSLLALLVLSAVAGSTAATTSISNLTVWPIRATTSYFPRGIGNSRFINRLIVPGTYQSDEYSFSVRRVHIELWVAGSRAHKSVEVDPDRSIVGFNNADKSGVDIYLARYGSPTVKEGGVLITLFP